MPIQTSHASDEAGEAQYQPDILEREVIRDRAERMLAACSEPTNKEAGVREARLCGNQ